MVYWPLTKSSTAKLALEWSFACVSPFVISNFRFPGKTLSAQPAHKRFKPRMHYWMHLRNKCTIPSLLLKQNLLQGYEQIQIVCCTSDTHILCSIGGSCRAAPSSVESRRTFHTCHTCITFKNHELPQKKKTSNTYSKGLGRLEWVFSCALKEYLLAKSLPQESHTYGLTPRWVLMCSSSKFLLLYLLLQLLHCHALAWGKWILIRFI